MDDKTLVERQMVAGDIHAGTYADLNRQIAALQSRNEALEAELAKAKVPHWFYHPDYTEVCEFSPWDVIDGRYDPEPGDHVFEIECARPLPSIWCAVRVNADPDADERFTFTEHSSEAEARKALEGAGNG